MREQRATSSRGFEQRFTQRESRLSICSLREENVPVEVKSLRSAEAFLVFGKALDRSVRKNALGGCRVGVAVLSRDWPWFS